MIERKIIIGLITSTDYIRQIRHVWSIRLLSSDMAKRLAMWCMEYFEKYNRAPNRDIEDIYYSKLKTLPQAVAEEIEETILPSLSDEYANDQFNLNYLLDQTFNYFRERHLMLHNEEIQLLLDKGKIEEAEQMMIKYQLLPTEDATGLDLGNEIVLDRVDKAFNETAQPVVRYGGVLGEFWNRQLVRGAFVALMGSSKRGKSYWLLDMAIRACHQRAHVAFFQAGDMTEDSQLIRIATYLERRSRYKKDCIEMYQPVKDCLYNQLNNCTRSDRECGFGIFTDKTERDIRKGITIEELMEAYENNQDYEPCRNCRQYKGAVWLEKLPACNPLTADEAKHAFKKHFIKHQRRFKMSTHPKNTLSVKRMRSLLDTWEKQDEFVPDIIVVDYADLLAADDRAADSFRHRQDDIWGNLRGLSMERHCLVVTATQADACSFERDLLKPTNFSEDKRKLDHVTAMYGLNQDKIDREKKIGIMRINEIIVREGRFSNENIVYVLQNLNRGRPHLESFF